MVKEEAATRARSRVLMGDMALLLLLLLALAADPEAVEVEKLVALLNEKKTDDALVLLKEIEGMKGNHAEAKALVRMIRTRDVPKPPEVMEASFLALKGIGSREATRDLLRLLENSDLRKDAAIRIGVCRALEGSADPAGVEALTDLMRDKEDRVIAAAADAAAAHRHSPEAIRKELFKEVLEVYVPTWNLKNAVDPDLKVEKARAERKWEIVATSMERALQLLSNVNQQDPPAWQRWWNKNKKKRWQAVDG